MRLLPASIVDNVCIIENVCKGPDLPIYEKLLILGDRQISNWQSSSIPYVSLISIGFAFGIFLILPCHLSPYIDIYLHI